MTPRPPRGQLIHITHVLLNTYVCFHNPSAALAVHGGTMFISNNRRPAVCQLFACKLNTSATGRKNAVYPPL